MLKKLLVLIISMLVTLSDAHNINYDGLCDELKLYKKEWGDGHAGHLWEHTVWTVKAMEALFATHSKWVEGIDRKYEYLMIVAALLHDIGKAGDGNCLFMAKPQHPVTGVDYLLKQQNFIKKTTQEALDFDSWLIENNITQTEDKQLLIILVGMHQEYGIVIDRIRKKPDQKWLAFGIFIEKLVRYCHQVQYKNGYPDEELIRMCIALCRADIEGMFPVSYECKCFPELHDEAPNFFTSLQYFKPAFVEQEGYVIAQELIAYCTDRVERLIVQGPYN